MMMIHRSAGNLSQRISELQQTITNYQVNIENIIISTDYKYLLN
jgi:hypothetical protein